MSTNEPHRIVIMSGHISPETAYVVDNYPYGLRLKCRIRYWIEYTPKRGVRMWSQTTNPKKPGWVWNTPKASTYCRFGGCMYLDEQERVQWSGLTEYTDGREAAAWQTTYGAGNHPEAQEIAARWISAKVAYDLARAQGAGDGATLLAARVAFTAAAPKATD
jgi:hypothetical protein